MHNDCENLIKIMREDHKNKSQQLPLNHHQPPLTPLAYSSVPSCASIVTMKSDFYDHPPSGEQRLVYHVSSLQPGGFPRVRSWIFSPVCFESSIISRLTCRNEWMKQGTSRVLMIFTRKLRGLTQSLWCLWAEPMFTWNRTILKESSGDKRKLMMTRPALWDKMLVASVA